MIPKLKKLRDLLQAAFASTDLEWLACLLDLAEHKPLPNHGPTMPADHWPIQPIRSFLDNSGAA